MSEGLIRAPRPWRRAQLREHGACCHLSGPFLPGLDFRSARAQGREWEPQTRLLCSVCLKGQERALLRPWKPLSLPGFKGPVGSEGLTDEAEEIVVTQMHSVIGLNQPRPQARNSPRPHDQAAVPPFLSPAA